MRLIRDYSGDTIVEVLLAMGVLALMLVGAFASANQSLLASRRSQERGEAQRVAESQLELVKAYAPTNPSQVFSTTAYCYNSSGAYSSPPCNFYNLYDVVVNYAGPPNDNFTVSVTWAAAGGGAPQQLIIDTRIHP